MGYIEQTEGGVENLGRRYRGFGAGLSREDRRVSDRVLHNTVFPLK